MSTAAELEFLTSSEVAALLRMSRAFVNRAAQRGELPAVQIGRAWRFLRADVMAWIEGQRTKRG